MIVFDWSDYEAVLFDLDGVLTDTARLHAEAWKRTFDGFLARRAGDWAPFDARADYRQFVDGRPRYEGVDSFLRSRGIELPWGAASDQPGDSTVCAVGNAKNALVEELISTKGADAYEGSRRLAMELREHGLKVAVVSASANCTAILRSVGMEGLFDAQIDGREAARLGLRGKPHPDPFLEAARRLEVDPSKTIVVEDALSGVEAGRAGDFGLVIGVDRHDDPESLREHGADLVVADLSELL